MLSYNSEYFAPTMINMVNTFFDSDPLNIQLGATNWRPPSSIGSS